MKCVIDRCENEAVPPDGPFCPEHGWDDLPLLTPQDPGWHEHHDV